MILRRRNGLSHDICSPATLNVLRFWDTSKVAAGLRAIGSVPLRSKAGVSRESVFVEVNSFRSEVLSR